jgi:ABC-type multidrug transport system fused ATPase/permease subunit
MRPKPQTQEPALVSADTILAAVRLATGKASKEDIAAVAKAIGADAAIKLLLT